MTPKHAAITTRVYDNAIVGDGQEAVDFIGKDLDGRILLWNEGARRFYGYDPAKVVGAANSSMLHVPENMAAGRHREIMDSALRDGKWEGTIQRLRKNGSCFVARLVITPRRDAIGEAIGYLLIGGQLDIHSLLGRGGAVSLRCPWQVRE